jgi:hypothetical protein
MTNKIKIPKAELAAHVLWDRLYVENPAPGQIDKDACIARTFRRLQLMAELQKAASDRASSALSAWHFQLPSKG